MARQRRRGGWLSSILGGASADPPGTTYELRVLEGADSGAVFPLDQPQLQIGRRIPGEIAGGIGLSDRSVSARHALVSCEDGQVTVEHLPSATNPTLVNGRRIKRKQVRDGDRIVLGLVVLELRAKRPLAQPRGEARVAPSEIDTDPVNVHGELVLREGIDELAGGRFPLIRRRTSIGRDEDCDIVLDVTSVSRAHAALVWEGEQLVLIHESAVNPTHVNGMQVRDRRRLFHGDEIRISERVAFEVVLEAPDQRAPAPKPRRAERAPQEEEATRFTTPPGQPPEAGPSSPSSPPPLDEREEPTQISMAVPPADDAARPADDAAATIVEPMEEAAAPTVMESPPEAAPTVIEAAPEAARTVVEAAPEAAPTVIEAPPDPDAFSEGNETRVAPAPGPVDYSAGDATRVAPAPDVAAFQDAAATRIAPAPDLGAGSDATMVAGGPASSPDPKPAPDSDATMVRPSPAASPPVSPPVPPPSDAERTRVVDLDAVLGASARKRASEPPEEARTLIRPAPRAPARDDAAATVIRPRPTPPADVPAAQTVILGPEREQADDENEDDDEPSS